MATKLTFLLLSVKLRWGNVNSRCQAARRLAALKDPRAIPLLERAAKDASSTVRWEAIRGFDEFGAAGIAPLAAVLDNTGEDTAQDRRETVAALSRIGGDAALAIISDMLGDADSSVREQALSCLRRADGGSDHLRAALTSPDAETRRLAAGGLGARRE